MGGGREKVKGREGESGGEEEREKRGEKKRGKNMALASCTCKIRKELQ